MSVTELSIRCLISQSPVCRCSAFRTWRDRTEMQINSFPFCCVNFAPSPRSASWRPGVRSYEFSRSLDQPILPNQG
jgi:hypothetical protein